MKEKESTPSLADDMAKLFKEENMPDISTELNIWKLIESLGAVIWRMAHDDADGRITLADKDNEFMVVAHRVQERLVEKLEAEYNVIPPQKCPRTEPDQRRQDLPHASGYYKIYYWDWYGKMKSAYYQEEYENIICSACTLHKRNGAEVMQSYVPCDVYPGIINHLIFPWECAMLQIGNVTSMCSGFWSEERLLSEIKKKGGEDSVMRYKQKLLTLKEKANIKS